MKARTGTPQASRPYRLAARAEAMEALRDRILEVTDARFAAAASDQFSLEDIARDAGTTVQSVLRHFGSKERVIDEALCRTVERIREQRGQAPVDDVPSAIGNLLAHYEAYGDRGIRMLAEEQRSPVTRNLIEEGRALHRDWVAQTFAAQLAGLHGAARERRLAQLITICDVYVWKLLRRDLKLGPAQTRTALLEIIQGLEERR